MLIAVIFKAAFLEKEKRLLMQFILGHEWYHCNCCFVFCIFCPLQTKSRIKRGQEKKVLWFWKWSWSMLRAFLLHVEDCCRISICASLIACTERFVLQDG